MGRKGKKTTAPTTELRVAMTPAAPKEKLTLSSPTAQNCLAEVRSLYHNLIGHFKTKRKLRHRNETFHISLLKGDIKNKLRSSIQTLSSVMSDTELQNVMRDFGDGIAEVLASEIPDITVREEFQAWMTETSSLMSSIGAEFHAATGEFLSSKADLAQEFKLSILEKANRSFADRLAPKGHHHIPERVASRKRGTWLEPPPRPSDDSHMGSMSLDQIMDFISEAEDSQPMETQDDFGLEIAQFRRRLETAWSLERKVVPLVTPEWLQRVSERQRLSAA